MIDLSQILQTIGQMRDDISYLMRLQDQAYMLSEGLDGTIHGAVSKNPPVDADEFPIVDSADSWSLKKLTWANIKATLKTYMDTLYASIGLSVDKLDYGFVRTVNETTGTTFSWNDGTYTLTLVDGGSGWAYYRAGVKYSITGNKSVQIANPPVDGTQYFIYIDNALGNLEVSTAAWTLQDTKVLVAIVSWDSAATPKAAIEDERHGVGMPRETHLRLHRKGTALLAGGAATGYTLTPASPADTDNTYAISSTTMADENVSLSQAALSDGDGTTAQYELTYLASAKARRELSAVPYRYTAAGYIQYNLSGVMTQGQANRYYNTYQFVSGYAVSGQTWKYPVVAGFGEYSTLAAAQAEDYKTLLVAGNYHLVEGILLYRITWQTSAAYGTKGKCRMAAIQPIGEAVNAIVIPIAAQAASQIGVDVGAFGGVLTSAETDVQKALDRIDDYALKRYQANGEFIADDSGNELLKFGKVASAVNYISIANAATGGRVILSALGDDTNVDMWLETQGTGKILVSDGQAIAANAASASDRFEFLEFNNNANAVNYLRIDNAATNNPPILSAVGDDTNINLRLAPKGAGILLPVAVPGALAYRGTTQAVTPAGANLTFDTQVSDVGGIWSPSNGDRFTAPVNGYYAAYASFNGTSSGNATYILVLRRFNSSSVQQVDASNMYITNATTIHAADVSCGMIYMNAGDYLAAILNPVTNTITTQAATASLQRYCCMAMWLVSAV